MSVRNLLGKILSISMFTQKFFKIFHSVQEIEPFSLFRIWRSAKPRPMINVILQFLGLDLFNITLSAKFYKNIPNGFRYIVSKGPKYRFPSRIDLKRCREEIISALNDFDNRWCKREYVEPNSLKEWKVSIVKIVDQRIKFCLQNTNLLPSKPKSTFRHF